MQRMKQLWRWIRRKDWSCEGSITVEASIAVPLFFLVVCSLLYLFELMGQQMQIQQKMVSAAKVYEAYGTKSPWVMTDNASRWNLQWDISEEQGICSCAWSRKVPMIGDWFVVSVCQRVPVRCYTGKSMVPNEGSDEKCYVYVAKNGTVYHNVVHCTYLHLGIQDVSAGELETVRNRSGGIYKPCESCMKGSQAVEGMRLYITPYGDRYHRTDDCSGLRRTVRKVEKSEVGAMPPCSKCGKEE